MNDQKNKTWIGLAFGFGILAGGALGLYLNSDRGRKFRKEASKQVNEFGEKASVVAREKAHQFTDGVAHTVERSRQWVDEVSDRIVERMKHAEETAEDIVEDGMKKAKRTIAKKSKALEEKLN